MGTCRRCGWAASPYRHHPPSAGAASPHLPQAKQVDSAAKTLRKGKDDRHNTKQEEKAVEL